MLFIESPGLLRQPIAEGARAVEGHDPDIAGETLEDVLGLLEVEAEGLGQRMERLRPMAQARDRVSFVCGQLTQVVGLTHSALSCGVMVWDRIAVGHHEL
jgi:hypothetical protein